MAVWVVGFVFGWFGTWWISSPVLWRFGYLVLGSLRVWCGLRVAVGVDFWDWCFAGGFGFALIWWLRARSWVWWFWVCDLRLGD